MSSKSKSHKRSRADSADTDTLSIKTAEGEPLSVDSHMLRTFSTCARELPADAAEWDISGLLYSEQQQPFSHATVACWLACIRSTMYGAAELDADDTQAQLSTAKGLHAVLSFAHAVGSPPLVFTAACSQLDSLVFVVELQEERTLELQLSSSYWWEQDGALLRSYGDDGGWEVLAREDELCRQQVAEQCAALLQLGHVLKLQPLLRAVNNFIFWSNTSTDGLLYGVLELVFTDAVIDVAVGSGRIDKETYISSVLTRPCGFVQQMVGYSGLLTPVSSFTCESPTGMQVFRACMLKDFGCLRAGETVNVTLNLFDDSDLGMTLQTREKEVWVPAQLLLGRPVVDDDDWAACMSSNMAEQS